MQVSVLVDDVQLMDGEDDLSENVERITSVVASTVRLQLLDRCSLRLRQPIDLIPGIRSRFAECSPTTGELSEVEDGELRGSFGVSGNASAVEEIVERVDDVVESGPKVEEAVSNGGGPSVFIDRWDLADVEAIFQAVSIRLWGERIRQRVATAALDFFIPHHHVVMVGSMQFEDRAIETRHGLPLEDHGEGQGTEATRQARP
jgi:hypothetical protein